MANRRLTWFVMGTLILAVVYLVSHTPAVLLGGMFLVGKSDCSFQKTVAVANWKIRYLDSEQKMKRLSRLLNRESSLQLWATPRGEFWMPEDSVPLIFGVLAEQELQVYGSGPQGAQPRDVVIDCGADIGTYTRAALEGGAAMVISVEPMASKISCLRRNFAQDIAAGRVVVYPKGVWNKEESLPLYDASVVLEHPPAGSEVVQLTTLDNLVAELKLPRVDFIKMDIEGAEKQALEGARETLTRFKPRLAISTEHFQDQAREVTQTVRSIAPKYNLECGPCAYLNGRICPHVVFFH